MEFVSQEIYIWKSLDSVRMFIVTLCCVLCGQLALELLWVARPLGFTILSSGQRSLKSAAGDS